jgi:hypothetical protein
MNGKPFDALRTSLRDGVKLHMPVACAEVAQIPKINSILAVITAMITKYVDLFMLASLFSRSSRK